MILTIVDENGEDGRVGADLTIEGYEGEWEDEIADRLDEVETALGDRRGRDCALDGRGAVNRTAISLFGSPIVRVDVEW
ncbi:hypothetical protein [Halegenticoccus soli]|uniref:hypothetical protein n=1 Tax=Halegenticoccus soli TaxID=1985678 RepID=UPI000C6E3B2B|nr:hypothetical protein [Halegenticoccus soli]